MKLKKQIIVILSLLSISSAFTACTSDEEENFVVSSDYFGTATTVTLNATTVTKLIITTDGVWTIERNYGESSEQWFSVSEESGKGTTEIEVYATSNNPSADTERIGYIIVKYRDGFIEQTVTVKQVSGADVFSVGSDPIITFDKAASNRVLPIHCNTSWTVSGMPAWVTCPKGGDKNVSEITLSVAENTSMTNRSATLLFVNDRGAEFQLTIIQSAVESSFEVSPYNSEIPAEGGAFEVNVMTNLHWTLATSTSWLSFANNDFEGEGSKAITINATPNPSTEPREAILRFSYETFDGTGQAVSMIRECTVVQAGQMAYFNAMPTQTHFDCESNAFVVLINANVAWSVESTSDWLLPNAKEGLGNSELRVNVDANTTSRERMAGLIFRYTDNNKSEQTMSLQISQEGAMMYLVATPDVTIISRDGGDYGFIIESTLPWALKSSHSWLRPAVTSGEGSRDIRISAEPNPTIEERVAAITIFYNIDGEERTTDLMFRQEAGLAPDEWDNIVPQE